MKNHILPMTMILVSLIFLSGIAGCPQQKAEAKEVYGLEVSFSKDAPPVSVSVNQEFPIYINIQNKGGAYIEKGEARFYLAGIGPNLENVKSAMTNERTIEKESVSPDKLIFAEKAKFTFPLQNLLVLPLALTSCYSYGTATQANICIAGSNESAVCSLAGEKITSSSNSVSPVQISSLTEEVVSNKIRITFLISNKLGGQIYLPSTDCDKLLQSKDYAEAAKKDKVSIEIRSPEQGFSCKLQNAAAPYNSIDSLKGAADVGKVICEKPLLKEDHVSPFYIIMRYKYVSSITKSLNIMP